MVWPILALHVAAVLLQLGVLRNVSLGCCCCCYYSIAACRCPQESKYRDAIRYYQPLVTRNASNLLGVTAIVLANLCVSYIMTSQVGGEV